MAATTSSSTSNTASNAPNTHQNTNKNKHHKKPLSKGRKRYLVKSMFRQAKALERQGQWRRASHKFHQILEMDPLDAHSHLGLARLQARREQAHHRQAPTPQSATSNTTTNSTSSARQAFERGTACCPKSIHLWQAWALYEETHGNLDTARNLYEKALQIDSYNPYVCHAYGLMEQKKFSQTNHAQQLWEHALERTSTAALVCSLGELFLAQNAPEQARELYQQHLPHLTTDKDKTEVFLAMAWLEERYYDDVQTAHELIQNALKLHPTSSIAHVALARLEGRKSQQHGGNRSTKRAVAKVLANACRHMEQQTASTTDEAPKKRHHDGGRVYNAWAQLEVKDRNWDKARIILAKGIQRYPKDPMLLQAAGSVEERVGNFSGARDLYSASLAIEPTAPTLVAYALLELKRPSRNHHKNNNKNNNSNNTVTTTNNYDDYVKGLLEEALLLDPRHGPAYNAYGTAELKHGTAEGARQIFERGVRAKCADAASIYHGYAKMELSLGNVDAAKAMLRKGLQKAQLNDVGMDSQHRERALFLSHTLGMLELNSNRPTEALEVFVCQGIDRYGNSSQLLLGAALCEAKLGKQEAAQELFERSVLVDSKHGQAWQAWGVMEMRAGNISTARKLFDCGIKSAPNHGSLWQAYATMEGRIGDIDKARSLFFSGIRKAPRHVPLYQSWATLELREDNVDTAKRLLTKALTINKRSGASWLIAANIEQRLGNDGLVGLILRRGIECAPTDAELYRALGEHLVRKGDIDNAREILENGIEVNPLHAPTYHSLAELEARVFNVEGLAKLNKKASQIFNNNALQPANPSTTQAWGANIRARKHNKVPKGIAALAEKIVEDDRSQSLEEYDDEMDPFEALESMSSSFIVEGDLLGDLLPTTTGNNSTKEIS
ncbi:HAT [Seminavis robusta]|uniref:HAT n=1 Tax=Seminavis robusta TaxID=568900 RepID=A0A9N8EQA3_9STRA|nr:HAT [Seminavis robusta]|eukprot:Sro1396_g269130.1 HAT (895) ;mRNA; r:8057-11040